MPDPLYGNSLFVCDNSRIRRFRRQHAAMVDFNELRFSGDWIPRSLPISKNYLACIHETFILDQLDCTIFCNDQ